MKTPLFAICKLECVFVSQNASQPNGADGKSVTSHYETGQGHPSAHGFYAKDFFFSFVAHDEIGDSKNAVRIMRFSKMQRFEAPHQFSIGIVDGPVSLVTASETVSTGDFWFRFCIGRHPHFQEITDGFEGGDIWQECGIDFNQPFLR